VDGFVEFWDPLTGKYPSESSALPFQTREGSSIAMEEGISAMAFSVDNQFLATGSVDGSVAVPPSHSYNTYTAT
jgi:WD40 repeat protein